MKFKTIILSSFAVIALSSISFAQEVKPTETQDTVKKERGFGKRGEGKFGGKRGGHRGKEMAMRGLHKLNLTDAQKEQFKGLKERNKSQFAPQREEMKQLASKKRNGLITAEEENRFKELKGQMQENRKKMHDEMMTILTPEQKTQLEQMKTEMRGKMQERREMRKGKKAETPKEN
jgi:protein CpxP